MKLRSIRREMGRGRARKVDGRPTNCWERGGVAAREVKGAVMKLFRREIGVKHGVRPIGYAIFNSISSLSISYRPIYVSCT